MSVINPQVLADSCPFHGPLLTILGPGVISTINEPQGSLHVGHQQLQFWPILGHLVDYYSLFWGPRVIFTINERRGAFTCRPSTLTIFPDSGLFPGLFLTVLGVPELFP